MVVFFEWHRTAMDQKSRSGLPVTGEDTGLGALASPQAGYLGKVQERAASLEYCPWCTSKGLTYALRSYRINLQESVTLCTNPQCLFPLVSRSLEDVLASLVPAETTVGNKRKNALEEEELITPTCKRLQLSKLDGLGPHSVTGTLTSQAEHGSVNGVSNGQHAALESDCEKENGYHRCSPSAEMTKLDSQQAEDVLLEEEPEDAESADGFTLPTCSVSAGHLLPFAALLTADGDEPMPSSHLDAHGVSKAEELRQLKSPTEVLERHGSSDSTEDLCSTKTDATSLQTNEQSATTGQKSLVAEITKWKDIQDIKLESEDLSSTMVMDVDELVPVSNQLFWKNSSNLCWLDSMLVALVNCKSLRKFKPRDEPQQSSVWQLIRGYEEVCASIQVHRPSGRDGVVKVPKHVLLKAEADLQNLRMSVFKLLQPKLHCKLGQRETPVFALPLLLAMDSWVEPLFQSTFHWEFKCSECKATTTERVMKTLATITKILPDWHPLHAVHLAPCNVCCKKNQRRTMMLERVPPVFGLHFVEGLRHSDVRNYDFTFGGKHYSVTTVIQYNQSLEHFVTWICNSDGSWQEYDDLKHPDCKTHQKLPVPAEEIHVVFWEQEEDKEPSVCSPSTTFAESPPSKYETNSTLWGDTPDDSVVMSHNDIACALSASENITDTTATADASIGSTTLLDTFEGLTHNDIITLTLVEIKAESDAPPLNGQTQDSSVPSRNEMTESTPDSSSIVIDSEMAQSHHVKHEPESSEPDDPSGDPTFVPPTRGRRGRGKPVGKQTSKKAVASKAALNISPLAPQGPSKDISNVPAGAAQDITPSVEATQQASPVSSTDVSPLPASLQAVPAAPKLLQNCRWSFLLNKQPQQKILLADKPAPVPQVKPTPPFHSTPNPLRRPHNPGGLLHKPQLKSEESQSLPLKAAEMYDAFGQKKTSNQTPLLPPPEISPLKKRESSKVPPGLTDTEALRYKLLKKLKAKKKKLAKLNEMLGHQGGASLRPDSTDLSSPHTVTSSTYDGSICDDLLSDLLSPATTASNLSPDSTGFLEMLACGQGGVEQLDCGVSAVDAESQVRASVNQQNTENFLEDFLSQAVAHRPTEMEAEALSALELFI